MSPNPNPSRRQTLSSPHNLLDHFQPNLTYPDHLSGFQVDHFHPNSTYLNHYALIACLYIFFAQSHSIVETMDYDKRFGPN
jgi:hypothetical protein